MKVISEKTGHSLRLISEVFGINRSNLYYRKRAVDGRLRPELDDKSLLRRIKRIIRRRGSYGYRRVCAWLRRRVSLLVNHKKVYRVMKRFGLLLKRQQRTRWIHRGRVAVDQSNRRWCSDITGIVSWNGQKGRFAFILDCCDREVLAWRFQTHIQWVDIGSMLDEAIAYRFGDNLETAGGLEFLHDNGPEYIATALKQYVEDDLKMIDCCTPYQSPQSNGMAEAFINTLKRDYVYQNVLEDFESVKKMISEWIEDYNSVAPHSALNMMSPRQFINNRAA